MNTASNKDGHTDKPVDTPVDNFIDPAQQIGYQWIDISAPVPPDFDPLLLLLLVFFVVLASLALLVYYRRPASRAARNLSRLSTQLDKHLIEPRAVCFEIAHSIQLAFTINNLQQIHFDTAQQPQWQQFTLRLATQSYARQQPTLQDVTALLTDAKYWLKQAKRRSR